MIAIAGFFDVAAISQRAQQAKGTRLVDVDTLANVVEPQLFGVSECIKHIERPRNYLNVVASVIFCRPHLGSRPDQERRLKGAPDHSG